MNRLGGRKIIITGGVSGIVYATAGAFWRERGRVATLDRSDNAARTVADEKAIIAITCDWSDPVSIAAGVNRATDAMAVPAGEEIASTGGVRYGTRPLVSFFPPYFRIDR